MIRAAAKNFQSVAVLSSPSDYAAFTEEMEDSDGSISLEN